jgi:hypothetical protein
MNFMGPGGMGFYQIFGMENLIETLVNTVAFLMAMRIAILIGVILVVLKITYTFLHSVDFKRFWQIRKNQILRYRNLLKH